MELSLKKISDDTRLFIRPDTADESIANQILSDLIYSGFEIKNNSTIIDIGAHIGCFSIFASRQNNTILALEPEPKNYQVLKKNIALTKNPNIKCFNKAIYIDDKGKELFLGSSSDEYSFYRKAAHSIKVETTTLKEIFDFNNVIFCDLIKIDAEGAELDILKSLPAEYYKAVDKIILEFHPSIINNTSEITGFLTKNRFFIATIKYIDFGIMFAQKKKVGNVNLTINNYLKYFIYYLGYNKLWNNYKIFKKSYFLIDRFIGQIGILLKKISPGLYGRLKRIIKIEKP